MLCTRRYLFENRKQINVLTRFFSKPKADEIFTVDNRVTAGYLSKVLGLSHKQWAEALTNNKQLYNVDREDLINSAETLKSLNYTIQEICQKPMLLYLNTITIQNRHTVLKECGCEPIPVSFILKFITFMNRNVSSLKGLGYIPFHVDVQEKLRSLFTDIYVCVPTNYGEELKLKELRENILNCYLTQRLDMNEKYITKLWRSYSRIRHKSFTTIQQMVDILLNDLKFSKDRIAKNSFVLYGDPNNVKRMINEIKTIDGQDMRTILYKTPKIMMSSTDGLLKTLKNIKSFNIEENAITKCLEILTLSPDTVLERLKDLHDVEELEVLKTNPRILRLVHYQNKARLRLEYLNKLKVRCASLHVLSCGSDAFARFAQEGTDRTKGKDIVVFLSKMLKCKGSEIRSSLSRHPNWCHIPLLNVKQCYDYLQMKKFSNDAIFKNLYIVLYPIKRIEEKIEFLYKPESIKDMNVNKNIIEVSGSQFLSLILYLIESEYHFTGDGVWTEQYTHVENFHSLLPDFPKSSKTRYGLNTAVEVEI